MTLRRATVADASSIAALSIEVWLGTYLRHGINGFFADYVLSEFTTANMEAILSDPATWLMVSDNRDGIDGFVRVAADRPAPVEGGYHTEIVTFYVQPRHHGKGIGKALLNAALDQCRSLGAADVWLATNAENTPAIAFYLAQGFAEVGHTHFELEGEAYLNNVYAKALN